MSYALVGALWIAFSDQVLVTLVPAGRMLAILSMAKGWLFVGVTSALLYALLQGYLGRLRQESLVRDKAEQALREREVLMRSYIENAPLAVLVADATGRLTDCNRAALELTRFTRAELLGRGIRDLHPEDEAELFGQTVGCLQATGQVEQEIRMRRKDGDPVLVLLRAVRLDSGWSLGFCQDITARKQAEEMLRENEERLRSLIQLLPDALFINYENRIVFVNERGLRLWRADRPEQILGRSPFELIHPEYHDRVRERIRQLTTTGGVMPVWETRMLTLDGGVIPVETTAALVPYGSGTAVQVVARDISARKQAEDALRESETRLRALGDNLPDSYVYQYLREANGSGRFLYLSAGVERLHLVKAEEALRDADRLNVQIAKEQRRAMKDEREACLQAMVDFNMEVKITRPDGQERWLHVRSRPRRQPDGRVLWDGVATDITKRRRVEGTLQEKERLLHTADRRMAEIVHGMNEACFALDRDWRFTFVNDRSESLLRHSRSQMLGRSIWEVFHQLVGTPMEANYRRTMGERVPISFEAFSPIAERWLDIRLFPTSDGLAAFLMDISDRKKAEQVQQVSREEFQDLFDNAPLGYHEIDREGRLVRVNNTELKMLGRTADELIGQPVWTLMANQEESRQATLAKLRGEQVPPPQFERQLLRKDGTILPVLVVDRMLRDEAGAIRGSRAAIQDITGMKKLEEQFLHAQRMEAIGTLASGVAHDLNNILTPMLVVAGLLKENAMSDGDRAMLSVVERSGQRGAAIIRQLLTFSRGAAGERIVLQVRHLIRDMVDIMQETFPRNIRIRETAESELRPIKADPTQVHQVLMNLCVNARDAMPEGGVLTMEAANVAAAEAPVEPGLRPGPCLRLTIRDTGHGIPAEIIDRVFDPFFTTKQLGKGTGLGLSTVIGIVHNHGGAVKVETQPGQGTAFHVFLPADEIQVEPVPAETSTRNDAGHKELILVVDDEVPILETTGSLLRACGYRVITAGTGEEAVQRFVENQGMVQLVLTDIMMPGMDGVALIRALRVLEPKIRVIATSGLEQEERRGELAALTITELLPKPYAPARLLGLVDRMLATRS